METEPSFDDAANYRFENLYRVNWIEKLPDYQYPCLHLPFYQICDTFEQQISTSLYEDMVKMAYKDPDRIASIRQIVEKADESVIPDHFVEMYSTFENVLKRIKRL